MASNLRIQLLGPMRASVDGEPLHLPPRSNLPSLWAYLLFRRARPTPRTLLAAAFWPDESETGARLNLRRQLHRLQQLLPATSDGAPWILADSSTVQWNLAADAWIDVAEFEVLCGRDDRQDEAIGLYQGDLLEGIYDDWVIPERERLREMCFLALQRIVERKLGASDIGGAIQDARRMLRLDPLREETYRSLMRLHSLGGDRAGLVRVFNACRAVLDRELGVEPAPETVQLYQSLLRPPQAPSTAAPSVHAGEADPARLPAPLTTFIGRTRERAEVTARLQDSRLVTLTGIGGVGKTRLALAAAEASRNHFPDGVWWVDLAPLFDPSRVMPTIAAAIGLREQSSRPLASVVVEALRPKSCLLVLDNCEHLVTACADAASRLLAEAPGVHLLATSTEPLDVSGEVVWRVPPLGLPDPEAPDLVESASSYRLFVERASAALPTFHPTPSNRQAIVRLCRALDGIPLALELAAARLRMFSVEQLVEHLNDRFRLLAGGSRTGLPRHRTMEAVLDWSHGLLTDPERALLRRLSLFVGGFTLESAEAVCLGGPVTTGGLLALLSELVDKSLVTVSRSDRAGARYSLLETVGHYARVKLIEAGEADELRRRFTGFCLGLVEQAGERLLRGPDQETWFWIIAQEYDNLTSTMSHAQGAGRLEEVAAMAARLWPFWWTHGRVGEGRQLLDSLLPLADSLTPPTRARALHAAGRLMLLQGDYQAAGAALQASLEVHQALGDQRAVAEGLSSLGVVAGYLQDYSRADDLWSRALAAYQALDDRWGIARALNNLGDLAVYRSDYTAAVEHLERSVALFRELRSTLGESIGLINLGRAVFLLGDPESASVYFRDSLRLKIDLADQEGVAWNLEGLAGVAAAQDDPHRAARLFGAADRLRRAIGIPIATPDRPYYEGNLTQARSMMEAKAWEAGWAEGAALATEAAIGLALSS